MKRCLVALVIALVLLPSLGQAEETAQGSVTRGGFVMRLWESAGAVPYAVTDYFSDVDSDDEWATAVGWAYGSGLLLGTGGGLCSPERTITREEAAVLLRRMAAQLGRDTFLPDGVAECNDWADISPWADDSLYWATDIGLLDWSSEGRLDPYGTLTEGELQQVMERFIR